MFVVLAITFSLSYIPDETVAQGGYTLILGGTLLLLTQFASLPHEICL